MANIARAYEFPSAQTARSEKKEGKITAASRSTAHPKLLLETAKVAQNLVPFSIVFSVCGKIHWYICFGACKVQYTYAFPCLYRNIHTSFWVFFCFESNIHTRFFFAMLSRVKQYKKYKKQKHSRYSISIKKNTRIDVKIHMRCMIRLGKYIRIFYFSL